MRRDRGRRIRMRCVMRSADALGPRRGPDTGRRRRDTARSACADLRLRPAPPRVGSARAPGNSARWRNSANAPSCTAKPPATRRRRGGASAGAARRSRSTGVGDRRRPAAAARRPRRSGASPGMIASTSTSPLPLLRDAEPVRRRVRQVDDAAVQERAAVVDAHDHALAGRDVGDARVRRQRQRRVRRGHRVHVVGLADRRLLAVELAAVPRRDAALPVGLAASSPARSRGRAPCTAGWRSDAAARARGTASGIASRFGGRVSPGPSSL